MPHRPWRLRFHPKIEAQEFVRLCLAVRPTARAMASEARASTAFLGSLPILVTVMLLFTSPNYISPLFTDVRGLILLGIATSMLLGGIGIMIWMAKFEI